MNTPLLGKLNTGRKPGFTRLTKWDVDHIRRWATTAGRNLPIVDQIEALRDQPNYATLGWCTLRDILANESWHDPNYARPSQDEDRGSAQPVQVVPSFGLLCILLFLWRTSCGVSCDGSFASITQKIGISR